MNGWMDADYIYTGTGSRVQRSIRVYECKSGEMDTYSIGRFGNHLCMATLSPKVFLHQAEVDIEGVRSHRLGECTIYKENDYEWHSWASKEKTCLGTTLIVMM